MADQVNVKIEGDERDLKSALEIVQEGFAKVQKSSTKSKKRIKKDSKESGDDVKKQSTAVQSLAKSFTRLSVVASAAQKKIQAAVQATNAALLAQKSLLGGVLPSGQQTRKAQKAQPAAPTSVPSQLSGTTEFGNILARELRGNLDAEADIAKQRLDNARATSKNADKAFKEEQAARKKRQDAVVRQNNRTIAEADAFAKRFQQSFGAITQIRKKDAAERKRLDRLDQSQRADGTLLPSRDAPGDTNKRNVNRQGQFNQAFLQREDERARSQLASQRKADDKAFEKELNRRRRAIQTTSGVQETANRKAVDGERRKTAATRKSTQAIRQQSQPITLLVAKFALMAFAVQTVANIINSTFGAMLRVIDDFEQAAIATAVAVTGITASSDAPTKVFTQNLQAARDTFEELNVIAAEFFATGQELQLAFNTLAQRGVVVRENEFRVLGKLTDQIKLLTGGQNSQIQIQQELRAILDGNIRTTTAFGKSLQARGVDVKELSKEIRETGSIQVFSQFLTGLDAATGAIQATLSSVTATFTTLVGVAIRDIFRDTSDSVIATFASINKFLIEQRELVTAIGKAIVEKVTGAWEQASGILGSISRIILRIASNDMAQFAAAIFLINRALRRGPLGILLSIAGVFTVASGEASTFGNILQGIFNLIEIGFEGLSRIVDTVFQKIQDEWEQLRALIAGGLTGGLRLQGQVKELQKLEGEARSLEQSLVDVQNRANRLLNTDRNAAQEQQLQSDIKRRLELIDQVNQATADAAKFRAKLAASSPEAEEFLAGRSRNILSTTRSNIGSAAREFADQTGAFLEDKTGSPEDQTQRFLDQFRDLNPEKEPEKQGFVPTTSIAPFDPTELQKEIALTESETARLQAEQNAARQAAFDKELANIKSLGQQRVLTGREVFDREQALRQRDIQAQINQLALRQGAEVLAASKRRELIEGDLKVRAKETEENRRRQKAAAQELIQQGTLSKENLALQRQILALPDKVSPEDVATEEEQVEALKEELKTVEAIAKLQRQINKLRNQGKNLAIDATGIRSAQDIQGQNQLDIRQQQLNAFGGETNSEQLSRLQGQAQREQDRFAASNRNQAQRDQFNEQSDQFVLQKSVKTQIDAVTSAIDATFQTLIDGLVEGSFEFRDLAQTISKDFIKAGLEGVIAQVKDTVTTSLTDIFESIGDATGDAAAGAKRAAQSLLLGLGLLIAVLSRSGNDGDFQATGGGGGGGVDQSSVQTRGLIGGDQQIAIAEINNGLQEALIPTNAILTQIEINTRSLAGANGNIDLEQIINDQVNTIFNESLLQNA